MMKLKIVREDGSEKKRDGFLRISVTCNLFDQDDNFCC